MSSHKSRRPTKAEVRRAMRQLNSIKKDMALYSRGGLVTEDDSLFKKVGGDYFKRKQ